MSHTVAKRPFQHLPENEQKTNTKKEPQKLEKMSLPDQGNGKRVQEESAVEQRIYICGIHNRRRRGCRTYEKHVIENQHWNMRIQKYDLKISPS